MEYRKLGKTDERISTIGMGTWEIGNSNDGRVRQDQVLALRHGVELGINVIDTAEMYGDGKAEQLVGEAFRQQRDSVFIATKVSPSHLHHDDVVAACNQSLQRLGVRFIDLYQVHWPNSRIPIRETMDAMEKLVRDGLVRHIGVSNFSIEEMQEAQDALTRSELVSNQVEYSPTNRSVETDLVPRCKKEGVTIIAYSPLARGHFPVAKLPQGLLEKYHLSPAQLVLNWVTREENVVAIPKSAKSEHAEENANSVSNRLSQDEYRLVSQALGRST
jgi:diketogulonate reductase-like aldo/keto reductase